MFLVITRNSIHGVGQLFCFAIKAGWKTILQYYLHIVGPDVEVKDHASMLVKAASVRSCLEERCTVSTL